MRQSTGNVAALLTDFYEEARSLVNDRQGRIATNEVLGPFVMAALDRVPFLAASLFALSKGNFEMAELIRAWPGVPVPQRKNLIKDIRALLAGVELTKDEGEALTEEIRIRMRSAA